VLLVVATAAWVCVAAGVAGSGVGAAETVRAGVAGWVGVAAGVRDGTTPDRDGDADSDGRTEPLLPHADSTSAITATATSTAGPVARRADPLIR
jgi:hypothetical protein